MVLSYIFKADFVNNGIFRGELKATTGDFSGVLNANKIGVNGVHREGTDHVICRDNRRLRSYDGFILHKRLRVAGGGRVTIRLTHIGGRYQLVQFRRDGTEEGIGSGNRMTILSVAEHTWDLLYDDVNDIGLWGSLYDWGSGSNQEFSNYDFEMISTG